METPADEDTGAGFSIDQVPGRKGEDVWTWTLVDKTGEVLARAGQGYESRERAQVAIAQTQIASREFEVPT